MFGRFKNLNYGLSVAIYSRMSSFILIIEEPIIQIYLKFLDTSINLFSKCNGIKIILHGSVKTLTNIISLGKFVLGLAMFYVFYVR